MQQISDVSRQSNSIATQAMDGDLSTSRLEHHLSQGRHSMSTSMAMMNSGVSSSGLTMINILAGTEDSTSFSTMDLQKFGSLDSMAHLLFPRPAAADNANAVQHATIPSKGNSSKLSSHRREFIRQGSSLIQKRESTDNNGNTDSTLESGLIDYCIVLGSAE